MTAARRTVEGPDPYNFDASARHIAQSVVYVMIGVQSWQPIGIGTNEPKRSRKDEFKKSGVRTRRKTYFPLTINLPFCEVTKCEPSLAVGEAAKTTQAAKSSCQRRTTNI